MQGSTLFMLWWGDKDVGIKGPITFILAQCLLKKKIAYSEQLNLFSFLENPGDLGVCVGGGGPTDRQILVGGVSAKKIDLFLLKILMNDNKMNYFDTFF